MHKLILDSLPNLWQRSCNAVLMTAWIFGLIFGIWMAAGAGDSFSLMMRGGVFSAVSISGLLFVTVLPFLITASAVLLSQPWLLVLSVLVKAFCVGFCAFGIVSVYASAFWLVQTLLMFTDLGALPLLMWLWMRHSNMSRKALIVDLIICLAAVTVLGILDITVISPFAATLL